MIKLTKSLQAWNTPDFETVFKAELQSLEIDQLPLQQGLTQGSYSDGKDLSLMIISAADTPQHIHVKVGLFYSAIIAGCSCADDPTPVDELAEYCEAAFVIDKQTGESGIFVI